MSAQDRQPDATPVAGTQVKPADTDVPPETDESTTAAREHPGSKGPLAGTKSSRLGLLQIIVGLLLSIIGPLLSIKRGLGVFAEGFRGTTWDSKANEAIKNDLKAFGELRPLSDADKSQLKQRIEDLLQSQHDWLRYEAAVEAIANRVTWVLGICAVAVPAVVVGLTTPGHRVVDYFVELVLLALVATWPAVVLETLTGRDKAGVIWMALVLWLYIAVAAWSVTAPGSSEDRTIFVAVVCALIALTILLVARVYVVAWNKTALTRDWAERRLEAAVVWMLLGVVWVLVKEHGEDGTPTPRVVQVLVEDPGKDGTPTLLQRSGTARALLAQAAAAVHGYLPRLIDGGRAYSVDAQPIASEAAAALLDLKSAVNLPGGRVREEDLVQLTAAVEAWSIGSLADLPRKKVATTADSLESASRRPGLLQVARNVLLGVLPLILLIAVSLLPFTMSAAVTDALAPFAVTWLLLSVASVFAPKDVKLDTKTLLGLSGH